MPSPKLDKLVQKHLKIREHIATEEKAHKEKLRPYRDAQAKIEAAILQFFDETGQQSAKTAHGTPYVSLRESISVASRDDFLDYVRDNEAWDLLENRVSKTAAKAYMEEHEELPPGLSYRAERTINVRSK